IMLRPPPSPTLFPYTTLFRSGPNHSYAGEHVVEVFGGPLARADTRDEAAVLLQVLSSFLRIEDDRGIEEREEDDPDRIKRHVHRSEEHTSELQSRENLVCRLL